MNRCSACWARVRLLEPRLDAVSMERMVAFQFDSVSTFLLTNCAIMDILHFLHFIDGFLRDWGSCFRENWKSSRNHSNHCKLSWSISWFHHNCSDIKCDWNLNNFLIFILILLRLRLLRLANCEGPELHRRRVTRLALLDGPRATLSACFRVLGFCCFFLTSVTPNHFLLFLIDYILISTYL